MIRIKSPQDFGAGLLFMLIGGAGLLFGRDLSFGTGRSMGPGYFPTIISYLIIALGVLVAARALVIAGPRIEAIRPRPILLILLSLFVFAVGINVVGVVISAVLLVLLAAYARPDVNLLETLVFAVIVTCGIVLLFVYGLGQPLPIWWDR
jgi:hypothetical protein